jgi:uncharacterized protein
MRSVKDKGPHASKGDLSEKSRWLFKPPLGVWVLFIALFSITVSAQDYKLPERPDPPRLVNDMAGMLSPEEANTLENKLVAYDDSTSTQIAVVIIDSLEGGEPAQYATELATKWGIGNKGKDNGVLLLISKNDHKIFIATGRGAEANLPDIIVKRIIDHVIKPQFKAGQYYAGISAATDEMIARLSGQFVNDNIKDNTDRSKGNAKWIALVIIGIILLFIIFGGGSGGQTYNRGGSSSGSFLTGALLGSLLGGGRGGGDSGGGGGGGFGGFGGGDFGGGGAGGDW